MVVSNAGFTYSIKPPPVCNDDAVGGLLDGVGQSVDLGVRFFFRGDVVKSNDAAADLSRFVSQSGFACVEIHIPAGYCSFRIKISVSETVSPATAHGQRGILRAE